METTIHIDALKAHKSVRKAAVALGIARSTFFDNLNKEKQALASIQNIETPMVDPVRHNRPRYYIFTAAVRGAKVHTEFYENLKAYAKFLGAELVIGALTSVGRQRYAEYDPKEFDESLLDYISNEPIVIGNRIRFCPELNLAPTMVKPLQGLQTYTKKMWGVFPHTKISVDTVPTHKDRPAKFIATTGSVTHPYYTPTKAGYRAHFDHVHGACIVEVTKKGVWFRHLTPSNEIDGTFYDLGMKVTKGKVDWNPDGVEAIIYGDIHAEKLDPQVAMATWGMGARKENFTTLVEALVPKVQIIHDLMDMTAANYHELDNLFKRYERWWGGNSDVGSDFNVALDFLDKVHKFSNETVIVDSNHEYFIEKWLLRFDPSMKEDFENIDDFYKLKLALLKSIRDGKPHSMLETLLRAYYEDTDNDELFDKLKFLKPDDSYEIHNVECGWHGHRGPNGRRGSKNAFKFVTEKSTIAHLHSPSIDSGCHVVGTSTKMDLGYNAGPSSWAHTHGIIYPNGGRTLVTMSDGKMWASQGDVA